MSADKPVYPGESNAGLVMLLGTAALWMIASANAWLSLRLSGIGSNPLLVLFSLIAGQHRWPASATVWACTATGVELTAIGWWVRRWWVRRRDASRFDFTTAWLARGRELEPLTRAAAAATAERLGHDPRYPGVPLGVPVTPAGTPGYEKVRTERCSDAVLYSDWEQLILVITGPRRFKTTATVVPMVMEAPGAVITTSNRRDVVDLTEKPRRTWGPTFVFDPQRLMRSPPQFWVNPLAAITMAERYLWDARAEKLADIFLASSIPAGTRMDAFFDVEGRDLVARLMLAAAVADQPITRVWDWITDPSKEPVELLSATEFGSSAAALERFVGYSDRQKDGLFGTAKRICNVLGRVAIAEWVTPHPRRREFDPQIFLAERGTLYPLSKEGVDSASALSTALVWQTLDAAERLGEVHGGRLPVPLVAALDEVANVVNWPDLPAKYSHYGGRGIIVASVLQNWSQGVNCFGEAGMQQLWDAANIRKYGGGVADEEWLSKLSRLIGDHWEQASTTADSRPTGLTASGHGQFSVTRDARKRAILEPSQLHQLPRHREIVLWGGRPVMVRPVPYWDRIYGPLIEATKSATPAKQFRPPKTRSLSARALMLMRRLLRHDQASGKAAITAAPDTAPGQQGSS